MADVLVTGACGVLGGALFRSGPLGGLVPVCRRSCGAGFPGSNVVLADLADALSAIRLVIETRPGLVIHLAGTIRPRSWAHAYRDNVMGTVHLLRALRAFQPEARVVMASTILVGSCRTDPYVVSKQIAERVSIRFGARTGLRLAVARLAQVVAERERHLDRLVPRVAFGLHGVPLELNHPDQIIRPITDGDAIRALLALADGLATGGIKPGTAVTFAGDAMRLSGFVRLASRLADAELNVTYKNAAPEPVTCAPLATVPWRPEPIEPTLLRSLEWLCRQYCGGCAGRCLFCRASASHAA